MKLTRAVLFDVLIAVCIYLWRVENVDDARIFLDFYLWFICSAHWIFVIFAKEKHLYERSRASVAYDLLSTVVLIAVLLWLGKVTLAIALFIGWLLTMAKLDGYKKEPA
jgi:hypothetical protein